MLCQIAMPGPDRIRVRLLRGVDHIERHLGEAISLAEVAAKAALSEYHFHRLFRARFGMPVMDYVRRRRMARAANLLLHSRTPVIEVALEAGFESQAAFTRAFRKVYYVTPGAWRARGREVPWLSSAAIDAEALAMFPGLGQEQPRLETVAGFDIAGLTASFEGAARPEQIARLNTRLFALAGAGGLTVADLIGVSGGSEAALGGVLDYMSGWRIAPGETLPEGLERRSLAGGPHLVFAFNGNWAKLPRAYDFIFANWMPRSHHALRDAPNFDCCALADRDGGGSIEIWIPVEER